MEEFDKRILSKIRPYLSNNLILDVGCHDGRFTRLLCGKTRSGVGIDVQSHQIWSRRSNTDFIVADACFLPFKDDSFSVVLERDTLHHVPDCMLALNELFRVAKKHIILIESNRYNPISYYMVKLLGHEHFTKNQFQKIALSKTKNVVFKTCEAHFSISRLLAKTKIFAKLENLIERIPFFQSLLAYNIAIIGKGNQKDLDP